MVLLGGSNAIALPLVAQGFTKPVTFMCGALSEKLEPEQELDFPSCLLSEAARGLPSSVMVLPNSANEGVETPQGPNRTGV